MAFGRRKREQHLVQMIVHTERAGVTVHDVEAAVGQAQPAGWSIERDGAPGSGRFVAKQDSGDHVVGIMAASLTFGNGSFPGVIVEGGNSDVEDVMLGVAATIRDACSVSDLEFVLMHRGRNGWEAVGSGRLNRAV